MTRVVILAACALALLPATAGAHRLDEYLQASRVAIGRDRIDVEIDLTPGIAVTPQVLAAIDTNHDGTLSAHEAETYARAVVAVLSLEIDDRAADLEIAGHRFPDVDAMRQGTGTIRVSAAARLPHTGRGTHRILFRNAHRPEIGVYLANALVPRDPAIQIARQERDVLQRELRIDYAVRPRWPSALSWSGAAVLVLAGLLAARRRLT